MPLSDNTECVAVSYLHIRRVRVQTYLTSVRVQPRCSTTDIIVRKSKTPENSPCSGAFATQCVIPELHADGVAVHAAGQDVQ